MIRLKTFSALAAGAALVAVAACGGAGDRSGATYESDAYGGYASPAPPPPAPQALEKSVAMEEASAGVPVGEPAEVAEQFLAYSHSVGLRLPRAQVDPVMQRHVEQCRAAGPQVCQVINSNVYNQSEDYVSGYLNIRAKPEWIDTFMAGLEGEADAAGGEISNRSTQAEDLTRPILDMDARLKSQIALRDRLQELLRRPNAELAGLIEVERELARVTGEIESMDAMLKNMRLRVSMSSLTMSYETKVSPVASSRFNPLLQAFGDFFYNASEGLANVITMFAYGLPWLILVGVFWFIWTRAIWPWVRGRRKTTPKA